MRFVPSTLSHHYLLLVSYVVETKCKVVSNLDADYQKMLQHILQEKTPAQQWAASALCPDVHVSFTVSQSGA